MTEREKILNYLELEYKNSDSEEEKKRLLRKIKNYRVKWESVRSVE